jgi:hypothetical protein
MSKVKIQGNASGTGVVTLTAPNTNTDRTITLPDSTGSILDSTSTLDATKLSGALPAIDGSSLTNLPGGGKVLQVVQTISTTRVQISSDSYADVAPSLAITPSSTSSKILIMASYCIGGYSSSSDQEIQGDIQLLKGSTSLIEYIGAYSITAAVGNSSELRSAGQYSFVYLDSPSTTSATTYKFQGKCSRGVRIETPSNNGISQNVLTLMEIAG